MPSPPKMQGKEAGAIGEDVLLLPPPTSPTAQFEAIVSHEEKAVAALGKSVTRHRIINNPEELLVSIKAFIDNIKNIEEYEQKQQGLEDNFTCLLEISWSQAQEEISEILYKWGRFLLDHGKYSEGLAKFWDLYEKFPGTRWHTPVTDELLVLEQPDKMNFVRGGNVTLGEGNQEVFQEVAPYFFDVYPVTNAQYLDFIKATGYPVPMYWSGEMYPIGKANHPVVWVTCEDAIAYASWSNKRLPTEAEWELAARGTQGLRFPWGNNYESRKCNCAETGIGDTTPVGQYETGRSPHHCYDMAGNVWEWTDSLYEANKVYRVLKGGSWFTMEDFTVSTYRYFDFPTARNGRYGFRCAKSFCRPNR